MSTKVDDPSTSLHRRLSSPEHTPTLIIVSQLDGRGPTGVETHFKVIREMAEVAGCATFHVHPNDAGWLDRRLTRGFGLLLGTFNKDARFLWGRRRGASRMRRQLKNLLESRVGQRVVLYAQDPLSAIIANSARIGPRHKVVVTCHFNVSEAEEQIAAGRVTRGGRLHRYYSNIEAKGLSAADTVVFVSDFVRRLVTERLTGLSKGQTQLLYNFPSEFADAVECPPTRDLISIGTLEHRKNQAFLLRVLSKAKALGHRYTLTLAGDGPDLAMLRGMAREFGVDDQVEFLGRYPNAASLIPLHRIYVHSALAENMSIALIEALSRSRPIFAAPVGGIPEVFTDGVEGRAWSLNDEKSAAQMLISVLEKQDVYNQMSAAAEQRYRTTFSREVLGPQWMKTLLG